MAYLTVTTQADVVDPSDGKLSLREAVAQANASGGIDTILFSAAVVGQKLVLTGGELTITNDLIVDGDNRGKAAQTTIDANHASRVLTITGGSTEATLRGLVITNGRSNQEPGGGILLEAQAGLTLSDCVVASNDASSGENQYGADGGGIYAGNKTRLTLDHTTVADNATSFSYDPNGDGGGIATNGTQLDIRNSTITGNRSEMGGGLSIVQTQNAVIEDSIISHNSAKNLEVLASGGGVRVSNSTLVIQRSTVVSNSARYGAGVYFEISNISLLDSTVSANHAFGGHDPYYGFGGGIAGNGNNLVIRNSTITGNIAGGANAKASSGGGVLASNAVLDIANSIVVGNFSIGTYSHYADISGSIDISNGHNVFGSDVKGNIAGDRENIAPTAIFATIDPATGGGQADGRGIIPLKKIPTSNPALSAADPLTASATGQLGTTPRPLPADSLPDLGPAEADQKLSTNATTGNDVITGTNAANNLVGYAGNDYLKGLGGKDMLDGGDGSDVLDGGPGNDVLKGGLGVDLVTYASNTAVVVDLSTTPATAKRGSETDTLIGIEGAIGSSKADTFKGDANDNEFQGGLGKDTFTGGAGRDTYDFNVVADSPVGASRDVIKDFAPGQDVIDVAGIDADTTVPGNQSFRWVGKATLTGAAQLGYYLSGGNTIVRATNDADAATEVEIQLTGVKTLTEGDFRF